MLSCTYSNIDTITEGNFYHHRVFENTTPRACAGTAFAILWYLQALFRIIMGILLATTSVGRPSHASERQLEPSTCYPFRNSSPGLDKLGTSMNLKEPDKVRLTTMNSAHRGSRYII
ncbi:hypothetical protein BDR06DRAFT_724472 [Suillus hirtellus]|nr:hypothetical protein BDR06DRAFT_724472 [Suillus hirtellus]